jgi:ribulose 1,5-bisphosphate synthetase/thiazole synthase
MGKTRAQGRFDSRTRFSVAADKVKRLIRRFTFIGVTGVWDLISVKRLHYHPLCLRGYEGVSVLQAADHGALCCAFAKRTNSSSSSANASADTCGWERA